MVSLPTIWFVLIVAGALSGGAVLGLFAAACCAAAARGEAFEVDLVGAKPRRSITDPLFAEEARPSLVSVPRRLGPGERLNPRTGEVEYSAAYLRDETP